MVNQTLLSEPSYANISQIAKKKKKRKNGSSLLYTSHINQNPWVNGLCTPAEGTQGHFPCICVNKEHYL